LRDLLQSRLQYWGRMLLREMQALRDPPLGEDEARAAAFQMKSFILGFNDAGRFLGEANARKSARAAFASLLERTERGTG
jgi:hypothetical protein